MKVADELTEGLVQLRFLVLACIIITDFNLTLAKLFEESYYELALLLLLDLGLRRVQVHEPFKA